MPTTIPHPIRILLLENDSIGARLISEYLDSPTSRNEIITEKRLDQGLEKLRSKHFDVILLTLSLPDSEGIATLDAVKRSATDAAIIILSNQEEGDGLSSQALQSGAQDYLFISSLNREILQRSIRYAMERSNLVRKLEKHTTEIEHREALLRSIFDANTDAMLILDREYEIKFFNPSASSLLEADETSLLGATFPFEVSTMQSSELEIPEANGGTRIVELIATDLLWEGERALLVMLRDITRERRSELALKREKERLAVTLDSIVDAVIATDSSGAVERINQAASRIMGIASESTLGKPLAEILRFKNPETNEVLTDPIQYLRHPELDKSPSQPGLLLLRQDTKTPCLVSARMRCITDEEGQQHGCVVVMRDITQQKKTEEERFQYEKLNSISLLAGGIAHDFNNMLTAILGNISVARMNMNEQDDNAQKLLAAENAALQAKSLTQQLLNFSKGGMPSLEITTIDQVVKESAQFVLRGSNVKCLIEEQDALWSTEVDKSQISQVINNLIINADQAMPTGGIITLKLRNCRLDHAEVGSLKAGEYVCIEVADQGVGISPENMKHIFEPYYTTKVDGDGLGLASSYSIIRSHKGAITVESEPGSGTCFSVYLPTTKASSDAASVPQQASPNTPETIHKGSGRILVMDDMEAMMLVAGEILNALGYEVAFATNGEEAIGAYKQAKESGKPFDAVVFDLTVPGGMGGEEACNLLIDYDPALIAIASSGYTTSSVMSDHKNSSFKAVVPKPYRIKEMSDALHRVLNERREWSG